jgi:hypothetical protein
MRSSLTCPQVYIITSRPARPQASESCSVNHGRSTSVTLPVLGNNAVEML